MPVPEPGDDESEDEFVSRCMSAISDEYDQEQALAICYSTYRESAYQPETKTMEERLHEVRRARSKAVARMDEIVAMQGELEDGADLAPELNDEFEALEGKIRGYDAQIKRIGTALTLAASQAVMKMPSGQQMMVPAGNYPRPKPAPKEGPGFKAARFIIGVAQAKWYGYDAAADFISNKFNDDAVAYEIKALNNLVVSEGGALIPQDFMTDIIELLYAATVFRGAGPTIVGMPMGNLTIPRLAGGASASYMDSLDDISLTDLQFDDVNMRARKLTALMPVANDLLRRAPFNVETIIRDALVAAVRLKEDVTFLRSDGSAGAPMGLRGWVLPGNLLTVAAGQTTLQGVVDTLATLRLKLTMGYSRMIRPTWFMNAATAEFIATRNDATGCCFPYRDEINRGMLDGIPLRLAPQIPTNLGAGNGTELYLVDMADVLLGETMQVQVDASSEAAYYGTDTAVVSAFQRDQTLFRIITAHDLNMRHLQSLAIGITSNWTFTGLAPSSGPPWTTTPLNKTWASAPAAWPAVRTGALAAPTLFDPGVGTTAANSEAFAINQPPRTVPSGGIPGGIPRPGGVVMTGAEITPTGGEAPPDTPPAAPPSSPTTPSRGGRGSGNS